MTDLDTLLARALALVNEDRRGELADIIEQVADASSRSVLAAVIEIVQAEAEMERAYVGEMDGAAYGLALLEALVDKLLELAAAPRPGRLA